MRFRDHEEIMEAGEFIVVPLGVEHRPVALKELRALVLPKTASTLSTGPDVDHCPVEKLSTV